MKQDEIGSSCPQLNLIETVHKADLSLCVIGRGIAWHRCKIEGPEVCPPEKFWLCFYEVNVRCAPNKKWEHFYFLQWKP